jgi:hypothetical protein
MNRSLKIFVACALGGGIGSFVALQWVERVNNIYEKYKVQGE